MNLVCGLSKIEQPWSELTDRSPGICLSVCTQYDILEDSAFNSVCFEDLESNIHTV
jgi:hypothetical protein